MTSIKVSICPFNSHRKFSILLITELRNISQPTMKYPPRGLRFIPAVMAFV